MIGPRIFLFSRLENEDLNFLREMRIGKDIFVILFLLFLKLDLIITPLDFIYMTLGGFLYIFIRLFRMGRRFF